jgi:hypothetical protein
MLWTSAVTQYWGRDARRLFLLSLLDLRMGLSVLPLGPELYPIPSEPFGYCRVVVFGLVEYCGLPFLFLEFPVGELLHRNHSPISSMNTRKQHVALYAAVLAISFDMIPLLGIYCSC